MASVAYIVFRVFFDIFNLGKFPVLTSTLACFGNDIKLDVVILEW